MKTKSYLILAGVLLCILNTLGLVWIHHDLTNHKDTVRIQSARWFPDNINPDRIKVTFDRDIVLLEQIGKAAGDLFVIEPALPGKWRWQAPNAAEFLLSTPIGPGRKIHLQPAENFFDLTAMKLDSDYDLYLKTISLHWVQSKIIAADDRDITIEMEFNQLVEPGDLLRHATFYDETKPEKAEIVDVKSLTHSASSKIALRMRRPASNLLEIVLNGDLKGYQADLPLGQSLTQQLKVDPRFMFIKSSVSSSPFESSTSVRLEFSQRLSKKQKIPPIIIKPEVKNLKAKPYYDDLVLTGAFEPAKQYCITISSVLSSNKNKTLGKDIQVTVDIPDRESGVEFVHPGGILSPEGRKTLDLKAVNVSGLELKSWRVYENNLVSYLHRNSRNRTSQHIQEKTLELDLPRNEILEFALELDDLIKPGPGIYYLSAKDTQNYWRYDSTMVLLSDLAITSKISQNGVMVWVTSVRQGEPVKGVVVKGLSYKNQALAQAVTDENGIAQLAYASGNPKGKIWLITAQHGKDLNYIKPADRQWVIEDVDQSGRPWPQSLEIMLYPERGVYRPGDKIHLTGIVRNKDGKVPPVMPFNLKVLRPDGKEIDNAVITPLENGQGIFHKSIQTTTDFQTGIYTFNMTLPGSSKVLGTTQASVEAFIPLRMKVDAQNGQDRYGPDVTPALQVSSQYLWEQPAAQVPVKVRCTLEARHFQSKMYKDYHFGLPVSGRSINVQEVAQTLDERGKATVNIPLPDSLEAGLYKLYLTATVTEPGARSVSSNTSAFVDKLDHHIGLKNLANRIIEPNEPLSFDWISLTGQDLPFITDQLRYELFSVEYYTVLKVVNRKRVWRSEEDLSKVTSGTIPDNNSYEGTFEINCPDSGYYRLIIKDAKTTSSTQLDFYASTSASKHSLEMNQPEHLEIITDKKEYLPGQEVDVLIRSPIAGKAFVTIETDHVLHYQFAEVKDNSVKLTLPLSNTIRGSAYISAIVIRGVDSTQKDWLPHRAFGMTRIRMNHDKKQLPVTITSPDKIEPEQTISVAVGSGTPVDPNHPAMIHLWAVDEGILLASDYRTPDPFNFFLQPRQPGVFGSDLFGRLMPDYERPKSMMRIGADSNPRMLRRNPVPARHRKPDVIWNQVLPTDETGQIQVQMKLPKLIGQLRLMAVAFEQDRYGKSQKPLVLSEDLIVEFSCPRFAAPGDMFMIPIKVFNNRTEPMNVALDIGVEGPLRIETPKDKELTIEAQKSHTVMVQATALEIGLVDVKIAAKQINATDSSSLTAESSSHFSVRPSTALHSEICFKTIEAGESLIISPSGSFTKGTERLNLKIYSKPTVQMAPALEKLIGYPYGCVEQTTSRLFGLLNAHQILDPSRSDSLESMVQAGLTRLWGMQTRAGGLSYWPGGTRPYPWGSAYAGWCLMEARKAGHSVDPRFSDELMKYLESLLREKNTRDEMDQNTKALLCRVLTDFGRPPTGWMNSLAERKDRLDLAGLAHLAAAFHRAGRTQEALELLPEECTNLTISTTTSGRLTSRLQQQAVLLSVLLEIDPSQNMIAPLVAEINKAQSNGVWKSTLENAAAIVALSRYQIQTSHTAPDFTGQITFSGHSPVPFDHKEPFVHQINKLDGSVQIATGGTGNVYIAQISEGLAKPDLMKPYDKRISVKRTWLDREKKVINPGQLKVGDLVNVEIELVAKDNSWIDNIAVVDALAGGMEVENPRLAGSARQRGYQETAVQTEFLDDRVILFCSASSKKRIFRYALRVIAAGAFEIPPIQASCMYDPSIASLGTAGKMTVEP